MGIVNVTPDSFSDGGRFFTCEKAWDQVQSLLDDGADIIDLGAESSRPNAPKVSAEEEWQRLEPLLKKLDATKIRVSVDTYKPEIMRRLLNHRVEIINDIHGANLVDDVLLKSFAQAGLTYLAMHMHKNPSTMQQEPLDRDQAKAVIQGFYTDTEKRLRNAGFPLDKIWLDPGIGFGKNDQANLYLIQDAMSRAKHSPIALGISRKSFLGRLLDIENPMDRDGASKMLEMAFLYAGVKVIRTHDVKRLKRLRDLI